MNDLKLRNALNGLMRAVEMFGMDSAESRRAFKGPMREARIALGYNKARRVVAEYPGGDPDWVDDRDTADTDSDLELVSA